MDIKQLIRKTMETIGLIDRRKKSPELKKLFDSAYDKLMNNEYAISLDIIDKILSYELTPVFRFSTLILKAFIYVEAEFFEEAEPLLKEPIDIKNDSAFAFYLQGKEKKVLEKKKMARL